MDIQFNLDSGLTFSNGDFAIGGSNRTEVAILVDCMAGSIRNNPLLGIGIDTYLNSVNLRRLKGNVNSQVSLAGNTVIEISVTGTNINIIAEDV